MRLFFIVIFGAAMCFSHMNCSYTIKVKDGPTAYGRKYYAQAAPMLEKEYRKLDSRVEKGKKAFMIGECYRNTGQPEAAIKWYQVAYDNSYGPEALKERAYMLKQTEQYTEALTAFKQLGQEIGSQYEYRRQITACTIADGWKKVSDLSEWKVEQSRFNSTANDFSATLAPDGRVMFSSDRALSTGKKNYLWTERPYLDIYIVDPEGASPQLFDLGLSTAAHESHLTLHPNGQEAWFCRSEQAAPGADHYMRIFHTRRADGRWTEPEAMTWQKERTNYIHPCLSPDGKTLYFSTTDGLQGGYDICYSVLEKNEWTEPKALPRVINTTGNDVFPVWNGDTLYFSSTEHTGMGGLDIFKTWRMADKSWAPPINLKYPINSGSDDFGYCIVKQATTTPTTEGAEIASGFFSSNRPGGKGHDDIYAFVQKVPKSKPPVVVLDTVPTVQPRGKIILDVFVLEKILADAKNPNSAVLGRKPLVGAQLTITQQGKQISTETLKEGTYSRELAPEQNLEFRATSEGFLAGTGRISTAGFAKDNATDQRLELEIVLDRIYKNQEIVLENIYYDYDRAEIRLDAEPALRRLSETLEQNPSIKIQLGSHTDCRGNDRYNQDLSQRRAQSVVNYLIAKGIDPSRLSAVGYGEAAPVATCSCQTCTEGEHQLNRRTTFRIVE
jgi:peptidoglycan-associated lipoprotein